MDRCPGCGADIPSGEWCCPECSATARITRTAGAFIFPPGQRIADRFLVEGVLGSGSSGAVYAVMDERVGRRAALKVLWDKAEENSESFQRVRREVLAAQGIRDPAVVAVHDLLILDGRPALLMELVEGSSLRQHILREGALAPADAVKIIAGVLRGLALLHGAGIVHRDIKSGNILLTPDGHVKICDFGLVKGDDLGATLTATGAPLGTPSYMAPELIRGQEATAASDLYSTGIVLFEMLAGRLPFEGASGMHVAHKHLSEQPPLSMLKEKGTPRWLLQVLARLLEKEPHHRFASAEETLAALEAHRAGGPLYRLAHFLRRHRRALAAACILAAVCATVLFWWGGRHRALSLSFQGGTLEARLPSGALAWRQTLPRAIQSACYGRFGPGGSPAVACALAWDDTAQGNWQDNERFNSIWVFDSQGRFVERFPVEVLDPTISPHYIVILSAHRFAPGEPERLVAYVRHTTWHPTGLLVYSLSGRRPWQIQRAPDAAFLNSGALPGWIFQDLDGDGRDDILCAGVNMALFWADFTAGLRVGRPGERLPSMVSPDREVETAGRPLFYRLFSFGPYLQLRLDRDVDGRGVLSIGQQPPWTIGAGGQLLRAGWRNLDDGAVAAFNGRLARLALLRDRDRWEDLLSAAQELPQGTSQTYDWIGRLFRAMALVGLGCQRQAERLLLDHPLAEIPPYAFQIAGDGAFLEGRYADVRELYDTVPENVRRAKVELGNTLLLSALYEAGGRGLAALAGEDNLYSYDWYPAMLLGAQDCLQGDPAAGERTLRPLGLKLDEEAGPRLWLAECLIRQGKMDEAKQVLEDARRWREEDRREFDEAEAWLQWCSGSADATLPERFAALAEQARVEARISPRARAFLPVTLSRCALILKSAGRPAEGKKLLAEALELAPKSWARVLATVPPHPGPKG